jgi:hypothetical protein
MQTALSIAAGVALFVLFTAWMNGAFLRCPHCRKIGAWRFDAAEPPTFTKDEDGVVESSRQIRVCRKCGMRVWDSWSDHGGRAIEKVSA